VTDVDQVMTHINDGHDDGGLSPADPQNGNATTEPIGTASAHPAAIDTCSREHPGIVIRPGPTGPRAALLDGPDVWEVIAAMHALRAEDSARHGDVLRRELRAVTGLTTAQVSAALDYYAAHSQDVDERIANNHEAAERAPHPPAAGAPPRNSPT
jgi:hypothetical protein